MIIEKIKDEIEFAAHKVGFIKNIELICETSNTLKIRLIVNCACFVQIYQNIKKKIKSYTVVFNSQRIFGIDCDGGDWHRHSWDNPDKHRKAKKIPLEDFLFETYEKLKEKGII